jgi:DNA-binding NtrC family response regulator
MSYRLILEMQGYSSAEAATIADAKEILASRPVDLILCDLTLGPGESGTDVIEHARSAFPNIPCALLTGHNTEDLREWASKHGVALMQKPIPIHQLLQAVQYMVDMSRRKRA